MKDLIAHVQNTRECLLITEKSIRLLIVVVLTIESTMNELPRLISWAGRDLNKSSINPLMDLCIQALVYGITLF